MTARRVGKDVMHCRSVLVVAPVPPKPPDKSLQRWNTPQSLELEGECKASTTHELELSTSAVNTTGAAEGVDAPQTHPNDLHDTSEQVNKWSELPAKVYAQSRPQVEQIATEGGAHVSGAPGMSKNLQYVQKTC